MRRATCVISEDKHMFFSDSGLILQSLDLQNPVLQYVISVCTAFHKEHGFGLKSLLYLITEIYKLSNSLHQQGIPVCQIQEHLEASFRICKETTKDIEIQINTCSTQPNNDKTGTDLTAQEPRKECSLRTPGELLNTSSSEEQKLNLRGSIHETQTEKPTEVCYISPIKLRMLNIQAEDEVDLEDLNWFFTEDTPLDTSQINAAEATFNTECGANGHFDVDVDEVVQETVQFTSLKSGEIKDSDDDEFEDCFDDIPKVVKSQTFHSTASVADAQTSQKTGPSVTVDSLSQDTVICSKPWETRLQQLVSHSTCSDENEFDKFFDKLENYSRKPKDLCQQEIKNMSEKQQQNTALLEEILQKTSKVKSSQSQVWNCSRHFKTIESTLREVRGDNDLYPSRDLTTNPEEQLLDAFPATVLEKKSTKNSSESVKNLNNLISKLGIKTSSSKIFNSSRHYKTVKSTVDELHKVKEGDLLNLKEKNIQIQLLEKEENFSMNERDEEFSIATPGNQSTKDVEYQPVALGVRHNSEDVLGEDILDIGLGYQSIARGLSHGCDDVMDIVLKVATMQTPDQGALKFSVSDVHLVTSSVSLLSDNPAVVGGTVLEVSGDVITGIVNKGRQLLRTVVINGDVTSAFRHKGYKSTLDKVTTSTSSQQYITQKDDSWIDQVVQTLKMEQIDAVLARGNICPHLQGHLPHVVMVQNVPFQALQCICASSDITMATYVSDICQFHICPGLTLEPLHDDWVYCHTDKHYVTVKLPQNLTQSVVYSHPAQIGRDCFEQEFWRCCKSWSKALGRGSVLPGQGKTEEHCALALLERAGASKTGTRSVVMRELAQALLSYRHYVCNHTSITRLVNKLVLTLGERQSDTQSFFQHPSCPLNEMQDGVRDHIECYDEGSTKMASWNVAIKTALTLLQIDSYILTGSDSSNQIL